MITMIPYRASDSWGVLLAALLLIGCRDEGTAVPAVSADLARLPDASIQLSGAEDRRLVLRTCADVDAHNDRKIADELRSHPLPLHIIEFNFRTVEEFRALWPHEATKTCLFPSDEQSGFALILDRITMEVEDDEPSADGKKTASADNLELKAITIAPRSRC